MAPSKFTFNWETAPARPPAKNQPKLDKAGVDSPPVEVTSISRAQPVATSTPGRSPSPAVPPRTPVAADTSLAVRVPKTFGQIRGRRPVHSARSPRTMKTGGIYFLSGIQRTPAGTLETPKTPNTPNTKRNLKKNKTPKTPKIPKTPDTPKNPINTTNTINPKTSETLKSPNTSNYPQNPVTSTTPKDQAEPQAEPGNTFHARKRQSPPESSLSEEKPCTSSQAAKLIKARDNTEGFPSDLQVFQITMTNRAMGVIILNLDQPAEQRGPNGGMAANRGQGDNLDNLAPTEQMPARIKQSNAQKAPPTEDCDSASNRTDSGSPQGKETSKTKERCSIM